MNEAKLILDIGADVSQFNASIQEVRAEIKRLTTDLKSSKGIDIGTVNIDLTQLKRTEETLARFGSFAEGTLGALKAKLATLKQERLEIQIGDTAKFEQYSRIIDETATSIKNLENIGKQKVVEVIDPVAINSIEFFKQEIDSLTQKKSKISIDTVEGRAQIALLVNTIEYYKERIAEANAIGKSFDPIPETAINSINYFKQQIESIKERRAKISIDTVEGRAEIASLTNQIDEYEDKIAKAETIGKSTQFIDLNTIKGLRARLAELESIRVNIDIDDGDEIARLNAEIAQLRKQLNDLDDVTIDKGGGLVRGAAKARQSLVNLGLVAQDLPFGFIAIQNNIPNLVQSFAELAREAKETGVSVGTQLANQFKGTSGAILGIGLAVSVATSAITYLIQKYGSLNNAINAFFGEINPLQKVIDRAAKSLEDFEKNTKTVGETIADANSSAESQRIKLQALASTVLDVTKTENARKVALEELKSLDNQRFKNFDIEKGKLEGLKVAVQDYTNAVLARAVAEKLADRTADALLAREVERNLYSEQIKKLDELEKKYPGVTKASKEFLAAVKKQDELLARGISEPVELPRAVPGLGQFLPVQAEATRLEESLKKLNGTYEDYLKTATEATQQSLAFGGSLNDVKDAAKIKFEFDVPKTDEFLQFEKFFDPQKALDRLNQYGDVLLDVSAKESERSAVLKALQSEQSKVLGISATYFNGLKVGVSTTEDITAAVNAYAFAIQNLILQQSKTPKIEAPTGLFKLLEPLSKFTEDTRIPSLVELAFPEKDFDLIKERAKGLKNNVVPEFEKLKQDITNALILKQAVNGTALSLDEIKAIVTQKTGEINEAISKQKLTEFLSGPAAEEQNKRAKAFFDNVIKNAEDFQKNVQGALEKPFRDFFDTILEEGKLSFDSFAELFKDLVKRIAAQLIASGIAKILTTIMFPAGGALSGAGAGTGFAKFIKTFFSAGGLLGGGIAKSASNNVNFGGVSGQSMQLAGEVVFVQRGSDLIGAINRTNATINRVG